MISLKFPIFSLFCYNILATESTENTEEKLRRQISDDRRQTTDNRREMNKYRQHTTGTRQQLFGIWDLVLGISPERGRRV
jgi:hypothetical protein